MERGVIWTAGHSNRSVDELIGLLTKQSISVLADAMVAHGRDVLLAPVSIGHPAEPCGACWTSRPGAHLR